MEDLGTRCWCYLEGLIPVGHTYSNASPGPAAHGYSGLARKLSKNDRFPSMDNYMDIIPGHHTWPTAGIGIARSYDCVLYISHLQAEQALFTCWPSDQRFFPATRCASQHNSTQAPHSVCTCKLYWSSVTMQMPNKEILWKFHWNQPRNG